MFGVMPLIMAIASDHSGVALKRTLVAWARARGLAADDLGVEDATPVDYPDVAARVARAVAKREADAGIVIDGAGLGSAIAANKVAGVRAAMCLNETLARYAREHNGANVLTLGATLVSPDEAVRIATRCLRRRCGKPDTLPGSPRSPAGAELMERTVDTASLRRLIELIVDELNQASSRSARRPCGCHGVLYDCCPDPAYAASSTPEPPVSGFTPAAAQLATSPRSSTIRCSSRTPHRRHRTLCREAAEFGFATVCVNPCWVALAAHCCAEPNQRRARSWGFRWVPPRPTSSTTRPAARSSTAPPRSTW